ncbi:polyprenyl synthetase [Paraprevotella xylaniphila YIT 11841]|uniref:Polyprenyl synthetase n=1 Tax=Paraprevotella xylaniphila YIT 11841 TaxID=762982 RepID=F3QYB8_9BACT|nr:polyprenyl synthetase family protein [Paraprevotella xylaniphila]EGG50465.1 polyprenyl synthetase [Paraprevotella xylaniphila YIT 11841]
MYNWKEVLDYINGEIAGMSFERQPAELYEPIRYVLSMGGKRIRPVLMLMAYNLYKEKVEEIGFQAVAIEIYHNYTLLHDDLMDRADMRRGMATVHKKWDDNAAILSGDSMLVMAYRYMQQGCPAEHLGDVMSLFTETALEIGEGQQYDMEFEARADVSEEEYIEMIRLKTSVLLACALKIGAWLGGAPRQDAELLYRFGENLGLAFQLQDDYLDVYGDPAVFGKKIGGDILCNKKTYMLINALGRALPADRERLEQWLKKEEGTYVPEEKIAAVTALYNKMGIRALCDEKIRFYYERAREILDKVNLPEERKEPLWEMAQSLLNRKS